MTSHAASQPKVESVNWTKFFVRIALVSALFPLALFLAAGTLDWRMGWVYVVLAISITGISRYLMIRRNPGLMAERSSGLSHEDAKSWDKVLVLIIAAVGPLAQIIVAGLDYRFDWSPPFAFGVEVLGIGLILAGYFFAAWAMWVNAFYSSVVRIQRDRGQYVVTNGPYRIVRHPSYIGGIIGNLGTSLVLGSLWSLIPFVLVGIVLVIRTALEDQTLHEELDGYRDYARQTRFRLIPGVW